MPDTEQTPAPTRDEILQRELTAIREEVRLVPGRIFAWFFGAAVVLAAIWYLLLIATP